MEPISRSATPINGEPPLLFLRVAAESQRGAIYLAPDKGFKGSLTDAQYVHKMQYVRPRDDLTLSALDKYTTSRSRKTVFALASGSASEFFAPVEVFVYDVFWRSAPGEPVEARQAACIGSLFVPPQHRGHGYARIILRHVVATLQADHFPAPLNDVSLLIGDAKLGLETICT